MESQLKKPSTNSVGNWTVEEDEVILKYVYEKGKGDEHMMWGNLSDELNGRSGKAAENDGSIILIQKLKEQNGLKKNNGYYLSLEIKAMKNGVSSLRD